MATVVGGGQVGDSLAFSLDIRSLRATTAHRGWLHGRFLNSLGINRANPHLLIAAGVEPLRGSTPAFSFSRFFFLDGDSAFTAGDSSGASYAHSLGTACAR